MGKTTKLILMIIAISVVVVYGYNAWQNSAQPTG